jgi:hypothetical protein
MIRRCEKQQNTCWNIPIAIGSVSASEYLPCAGRLKLAMLAPEDIAVGSSVTFHRKGLEIAIWQTQIDVVQGKEPSHIYEFQEGMCGVPEALQRLQERHILCYSAELEHVEIKKDAYEVTVLIHVHLSMRSLQFSEFRGEDRKLFGCLVSHFQPAHEDLIDAERSERNRLTEGAKNFNILTTGSRSTCCVVGCTQHPDSSEPIVRSRFRLGQVLNCLYSSEPVEAAKYRDAAPLTASHRAVRLDLLADDVLVPLLERLHPAHLAAAVAPACRTLAAAVRCAVPGLRLTLYSHQRRAVAWMLERERRPPAVWCAAARRLQCAGGAVWYADAARGFVPRLDRWDPAGEAGELVRGDVRGGMLCDEPGMGKTITVRGR